MYRVMSSRTYKLCKNQPGNLEPELTPPILANIQNLNIPIEVIGASELSYKSLRLKISSASY